MCVFTLCVNCMSNNPSSIPFGPQLGPSWARFGLAQIGPKWGPNGAHLGMPLGEAKAVTLFQERLQNRSITGGRILYKRNMVIIFIIIFSQICI